MSDFIVNLTAAINLLVYKSGDCIDGITPELTEKALRQAASETLGDFGSVRLRREVSPEQPRTILTVIEADDGDWVVLDSDQFAVLRALVLTWDENILHPGTTYITPVLLEDGSVVSEWQPDHDE